MRPILIHVVDLVRCHELPPAFDLAVITQHDIFLLISAKVGLEPLGKAGVELFLRHDNELAWDDGRRDNRAGAHRDPVREGGEPRVQ